MLSDLQPVTEFQRAVCDECDTEYGRHDDGDCPSCGESLRFEPDRYALVLRAFEARAEDMAERHAPDTVCGACVDDTPLAMESAQDVPKARQVRDLADEAREVLETVGARDTYEAESIFRAYIDAYYGACADPEDCDVCIDAARGAEHGCGHDDLFESCPVADEE